MAGMDSNPFVAAFAGVTLPDSAGPALPVGDMDEGVMKEMEEIQREIADRQRRLEILQGKRAKVDDEGIDIEGKEFATPARTTMHGQGSEPTPQHGTDISPMVAAPPPPGMVGGEEDERGPDVFQDPKDDPWNGDANMVAMSERMGKLESMLAKALEALNQRPTTTPTPMVPQTSTIVRLAPIDRKNIERPFKYTGDLKKYIVWHEQNGWFSYSSRQSMENTTRVY